MVPSSRDWIFSIKTFFAAMLALYVALKMELPRPYWAMASVYLVSNTFVGPTTSKALYRVFGTLMGAAAAVVIVPPLVETPYLLSLAMAAWTGTMVYLSVSDRTARSYMFVLAGYTAPLITFPVIFEPASIFDVASARAEEIVVGIVVAAVVNGVLFPNRLGEVLSTRVAAWARDAAHYAEQALAGKRPDRRILEGLRRMASTVNGLDVLLSQLKYDAAHPDIVARAIELRGRMALLMPIITALADPLRVLLANDAPDKQSQREKERLTCAAANISAWISATQKQPGSHHDSELRRGAQALRVELASIEPSREQYGNWHGVLLSSILRRLSALIDLWEDCISLHHAITVEEMEHWQPRFSHWRFGAPHRHADRSMILFASVSAVGGIFAECVLWLNSNWMDGGLGIAFAAVALCLFAGADDPAANVFRFLGGAAAGVVVTGIYLFAILPNVSDFAMLVIVFAVPFIMLALMMANPSLNLIGFVAAFTVATLLGTQSSYEAEPRAFLNNNLGLLLGLVLAYLWTRTTRPFGAELFARRMTRASWSELALAAGPHTMDEQRVLLARSLDRLMQLIPRLAPTDDPDHASIAALRDSRVALNTLDLHIERTSAPAPMRAAIDRILALLHDHFLRCANSGVRQPVGPNIMDEIDSATRQASRAAVGGLPTETLHALALLRISLSQNGVPTLNLEVAAEQP